VFELLKLFPVDFAVLTSPTEGLPPALLGEAVETQETLDVSRYPVVVVVAAPILIACLLLLLYGRLEHGSDAPLDGLCRSREALALGPSFDLDVAFPMACAVGREAQEADGLWPFPPVLGGVSVGKAPNLDQARLFGCQCQSEWVSIST
jgi:hypothetical protein